MRVKLVEEYALLYYRAPPLPNMPPSSPGFRNAKPLCSKSFLKGEETGLTTSSAVLFRVEDEREDTREKQTSFPQLGTSGHYYKGLNL
jgi:hypothetical protein